MERSLFTLGTTGLDSQIYQSTPTVKPETFYSHQVYAMLMKIYKRYFYPLYNKILGVENESNMNSQREIVLWPIKILFVSRTLCSEFIGGIVMYDDKFI